MSVTSEGFVPCNPAGNDPGPVGLRLARLGHRGGPLTRRPFPLSEVQYIHMSTIPCDFCPHPVDRNQMEEIEISHYVPDSSGDDLAYARTYFFGHPDCVRKFYRGLVDHKLDLFKHIPSTGSSPEGQR